MTGKFRIMVWALCGTLAAAGWASAEVGDLFPETSYADKVAPSPVTHPEGSLKKPPPELTPITPAPPPVPLPPEPLPATPENPPATAPQVGHAPAAPIQPAPPAAVAEPIWTPYGQTIFAPFLSAEDRAVFDRDYAPFIQAAMQGTTADRRTTSDQIFAAAGKLDAAPTLQRYLYLHALGLAIRGAAPIEDRTKKAQAALPLLNERTLAVAQTRADCLDNLTQSALNSATDGLMRMTAHAYATLAELQAEAGYPREAVESLRTARHWVLIMRERNALLANQIAGTADLVGRSSQASGMAATFKKKLADDPKDPLANTQLALIALGIHGDLAAALPYAAHADKPALQQLYTLGRSLDLRHMKTDEPADVTKALRMIEALAEIARALPTGPDRFLVANFASRKLSTLADRASPIEVSRLRLALKKISDKIMDQADPYDVLAEIPRSDTADLGGGNGKVFRSVPALFTGCPALPRQFAGNNSLLAATTNGWLRQNAVGANLICPAQFAAAESGAWGNKGRIPLHFVQQNLVLADVRYTVNFNVQVPEALAATLTQLQPGQVATIGGTINDVTVQAYYGACTIRIDMTYQAPNEDSKAAPAPSLPRRPAGAGGGTESP